MQLAANYMSQERTLDRQAMSFDLEHVLGVQIDGGLDVSVQHRSIGKDNGCHGIPISVCSAALLGIARWAYRNSDTPVIYPSREPFCTT